MNTHKDINKHSFKLDSFEKKNIYTVPDRYFEELQANIQATVIEKKRFYQLPAVNLGLRLALPAAFFLAFIVYAGFFKSEQLPVENFDTMISAVTTEDLMAYLEDSEISTEEIIDNVSFDDMMLEDEMDILNSDDLDDINLDEMIDDLDLYDIKI